MVGGWRRSYLARSMRGHIGDTGVIGATPAPDSSGSARERVCWSDKGRPSSAGRQGRPLDWNNVICPGC